MGSGIRLTKRAVLYARVSYDDRGTEGRNLEGQLEMCRKHALDRGYQVVGEFAEDMRGARGADLDLEKLNAVLDLAEVGGFDVLVVREMDRLSRDTWKQGYLTNALAGHDCTIEFVLYDFPPTPEGELQRNILASFAEYEAKKIAQRLARGRRRRVLAGHVSVSGRPPYGYREAQRDGKASLAAYEPEARVVRMVYDWYTLGDGSNGPMAINAITQRLRAMRIPTPSAAEGRARARQGRPFQWVRSVVHLMLKTEVYVGVWRYGKQGGGETIAVPVPPIVSQEAWKAAQKRLERNRRYGGKQKYFYLLGGRVSCGHCGRKAAGMGSEPSGKLYRYY